MTKEDEKKHVPNQISLKARLVNFIVSSFFIIWGGYGVWQNDLVVVSGSGVRHHPYTYHLINGAAITMYVGLLLVGACLISEIVDHYDKRNNEHIYHRIATLTLWPGVLLFVIGFLIR